VVFVKIAFWIGNNRFQVRQQMGNDCAPSFDGFIDQLNFRSAGPEVKVG